VQWLCGIRGCCRDGCNTTGGGGSKVSSNGVVTRVGLIVGDEAGGVMGSCLW
jgi:hypothetical protein